MRPLLNTFDTHLTAQIQHWPSWLTRPMRFITTLGHPVTVLFLLGGLVAYAVIQRLPELALAGLLAMAVIGLNTLLKMLFQRVRPDTEYTRGMVIKSYSFPSGHSASAMAGFGLFAYLSMQFLATPWSVLVAAIFCSLVLLTGLSRIYLGAHFPSDVLVGWLVGGIGLVGIIVFVIV